MARLAAALVGQGRVSISSPLSEAKNDSARALSQHWPVRPWDSFTAQPLARPANSAEVYWQPLSAWKITPGAGSRAATAFASAAETSSVRR